MTPVGPIDGFCPIVPAGGAGTRLWPLSRRDRPKFLLDLTGSGRSLLQQTLDRLAPLAGAGGVMVVTGPAHAAAVRHQLAAFAEVDVLSEPSPKDSAAAIGLAAAVAEVRRPGCVVGAFAADHVVGDTQAFAAAVRQAVVVAAAGYVATVGIAPDRPATGYGYIRTGDLLDVEGAPQARAVPRFVEKPDAQTAAGYLAHGGYLWNAGMFVARAEVLLDALAAGRPHLHAGLVEIAAAWDTPRRAEALERLWPDLERVAIDYAVAEPVAAAGRMAVIPADLGWDDVGDFSAIARLQHGEGPLRVLGDGASVVAHDSGGLVVPGAARLVAVLGLEDVVVVDTGDAVLVTSRARAQDVKGIVDHLRAAGREDLL